MTQMTEMKIAADAVFHLVFFFFFLFCSLLFFTPFFSFYFYTSTTFVKAFCKAATLSLFTLFAQSHSWRNQMALEYCFACSFFYSLCLHLCIFYYMGNSNYCHMQKTQFTFRITIHSFISINFCTHLLSMHICVCVHVCGIM